MANGKEKVIAVVSPKGGVGRSAVSCLLALALEKRGQQVLLVDLDPMIHTQDLFFGVEDQVLFGFSDLLSGKEAERVLIPVTPGGRLFLCPGGGQGDLPDPQALRQAVDRLTASGAFDTVILDLPAEGLRRDGYTQLADTVLIVSTADPASLLGAQSASESIRKADRVYLLLNRIVLLDRSAAKEGVRPHEMIDLVSRQLIGILPESEEIARSLALGRAASLEGESLCPMLNIAARLEGGECLLFEGMREEKKLRRSLDP